MAKRRFRIDGGRYGGELVLGTVSKEFVEYWIDKDEGELWEHVHAIDWDDEEQIDPNSPLMREDGNQQYAEVGDLEQMYAYYADAGFVVYEVTNDEETKVCETEGEHDGSCEAFFSEDSEEMKNHPDGEWVPVLSIFRSGKGDFGCWYVETDGEDFDPKKLTYSTLKTNLCELINWVEYDGEGLEHCIDDGSDSGRGEYARVGWLDKSQIAGRELIFPRKLT
jgi:hypothetical protein